MLILLLLRLPRSSTPRLVLELILKERSVAWSGGGGLILGERERSVETESALELRLCFFSI